MLEIENQDSIISKEINPEFESIVDIKQETQKQNIEFIYKKKIKHEMIWTTESWICKNSNEFLLNGDEDSILEEEMKQNNYQDFENIIQQSLKKRIPKSIFFLNNQRNYLRYLMRNKNLSIKALSEAYHLSPQRLYSIKSSIIFSSHKSKHGPAELKSNIERENLFKISQRWWEQQSHHITSQDLINFLKEKHTVDIQKWESLKILKIDLKYSFK